MLSWFFALPPAQPELWRRGWCKGWKGPLEGKGPSQKWKFFFRKSFAHSVLGGPSLRPWMGPLGLEWDPQAWYGRRQACDGPSQAWDESFQARKGSVKYKLGPVHHEMSPFSPGTILQLYPNYFIECCSQVAMLNPRPAGVFSQARPAGGHILPPV